MEQLILHKVIREGCYEMVTSELHIGQGSQWLAHSYHVVNAWRMIHAMAQRPRDVASWHLCTHGIMCFSFFSYIHFHVLTWPLYLLLMIPSSFICDS